MQDVFLVSGQRTAVGSFGGSLKDKTPSALATEVAKAAIAKAGLDPSAIGHAVFGQVIQTEPADPYLARVAAINAGVPVETPALTVNRLCGSGLQAVLSAAQAIMLEDTDVVLAGGAESMSRAPYLMPMARWGMRLGDSTVTDMLSGALTDPFGRIHMGITAENVATRFGISRQTQDELALESHRRASAAIAAGYFRDQIVGIQVKLKGKDVLFDTDEHVRPTSTAQDFCKLKAVFKEGGTVTAGNASGINDGAAALILASAAGVRDHRLTPLARLVSYGFAGVDPSVMGIGPIEATRMALRRANLRVADLDVIESNEAFAAQACAVSSELGFDPAKVNPNGSGISIGHPVGATGAINTVKIMHELARRDARYGLVTMCIGGGQGIAAIFERA